MSRGHPVEQDLRLDILRQPGRRWFALFRGDSLLSLRLQIDGQDNWTDCQFPGVVQSIEPKLRSVFIRLDDGAGTIGLMKQPKKQSLREGQRLTLRCLSEPRDGKGPKLAQSASDEPLDLADLGDWFVHRHAPVRLRCSTLADQVRYAKRWPGVVCDLDDDFGALEEAIDLARQDRLELGQGAWLLFEPGETLTAIDLNTGGLSFEQANARMVPVLAEQLCARNLGGLIVVDAMELETKPERAAFDQALKAALKRDPLILSVAAISPRGLVVIERRREGLSLDEALGQHRYRRLSDDARLLDVLAAAERQLTPQNKRLPLTEDLRALATGHPALAELSRRLGFTVELD